jgi:hypothetical protein
LPANEVSSYIGGINGYGLQVMGAVDEMTVYPASLSADALINIYLSSANALGVLLIGQSNGVGNAYLTSQTADTNVWFMTINGVLQHVNSLSVYGATLGKYLKNYYNRPILLINGAVGGKGIVYVGDQYYWNYRNPNNHADSSNLYGKTIYQKNKWADTIAAISLVAFESEISNTLSHDSIVHAVKNVINWYKEDGISAPVYVNVPGRQTYTWISSAQANLVRSTVIECADSGWYNIASNSIAFKLIDSIVHFDSVSANKMGTWFGEAISLRRSNQFPKISWVKGSSTIKIKPAIGYTFLSTNYANGFYAYNGSNWIVLPSATKTTDTTLTITSGYTDLRYQYGRDPDTLGTIRDTASSYYPALPYIKTSAASSAINGSVYGSFILGYLNTFRRAFR